MKVLKENLMSNANLIENIFNRNHPFEIGIFCTFGLNLNFLENYLLKLNGFKNCEDICIFTDSMTYDGFMDVDYNPRWLNKKYLVNRVKTNGIFHPKLYMMASEKKAVIAIGSVNLTRDGIASNLELLSVFEISEKDQKYSGLLRDSIGYVQRLAEISKSKSAASQIKKFGEICRPYMHNRTNEEDVQFIHNIDEPIITKILKNLEGHSVHKVQIISPFYDSTLAPLKILKEKFISSELEIYIQQGKSTFPKNISEVDSSRISLYLYENIERYLHGKAMLFYTEDEILLFMGSANFTRSALMGVAKNSNYEIGLWGNIEKGIAENLLAPSGQIALKIDDIDKLHVAQQDDSQSESSYIEYITEAKLEDGHIKISIDETISSDVFIAKYVQLMDFENNRYKVKIPANLDMELTPAIKSKVPGKLSIQILGENSRGDTIITNRMWIVELEESSSKSIHRQFRRIYSNPFELSDILHEILKNGDEQELQLFLLQFNIPLDLVFPTQFGKNFRGTESQGNIVGSLPMHTRSLLNASMKESYRACLDRLFSHLQSHVDTPQISKINNYMMNFISLYSLIWTIGDLKYKQYENASIVNVSEWADIRNYYDLLFMYIQHALDTLLDDDQYRDKINNKIIDNNDSELISLEQYFIDEYSDPLNEVALYIEKLISQFDMLKNALEVQTNDGHRIVPNVFGKDLHLQDSFIKNMHNSLMLLTNILGDNSDEP